MLRQTLSTFRNRIAKALRSKISVHHRRTAVFIDADGTPPRIAPSLFAHAEKQGRVVSAQLFANFAGGAHSAWVEPIRRYGIHATQLFNTTPGKNAADIALAVAAIDLMHTTEIDNFVVVASDGDLAPLVQRLRRSGAKVHGVGNRETPAAFVEACDRFLSFADLMASAQARPHLTREGLDLVGQPEEAHAVLLHTLIRLGGHTRWVPIQDLGQELATMTLTLTPRRRLRRTLSVMLGEIDAVELDLNASPAAARLNLRGRNGQLP